MFQVSLGKLSVEQGDQKPKPVFFSVSKDSELSDYRPFRTSGFFFFSLRRNEMFLEELMRTDEKSDGVRNGAGNSLCRVLLR